MKVARWGKEVAEGMDNGWREELAKGWRKGWRKKVKLIFVRSKETGRLYLVKRYPRAYLEQGINNAKRGKRRRTFTGTILSITG